MAKITYDVHPSVLLMEAWIRSLPEKTGRSLEQWMRAIRAEKFASEGAARAWLEAEHNLGGNTRWCLAQRAFAKDLSLMDDDPERYLALAPGYVQGQYAGKKEGLRPVYERLHGLCRGLGKDVKLCPCKTIVPAYRRHVFAQIKPTTNTRVDLGLCLSALVKAGKSIPERLIDTGGYEKKDRITHRIAIATVADIDAFVVKWLEKAYELDAPEATAPRTRPKRGGSG